MNGLVEKFLSAEERSAVEESIRAAEKRTSGEIVVMVVPSSHHYPLANVLGGALFGLMVAVLVCLVAGVDSMWYFLGFFLPFFALGNEAIRRSYTLKRLFVRSSDMAEEVEEAAVSSFYSKEVYDTEGHNGVLIYISLFEHRAWVLADKGLHAKVDPAAWREVADLIVDGIREKTQAETLCRAINRCGDMLARHFPPQQGGRNELDDTLIMGNR